MEQSDPMRASADSPCEPVDIIQAQNEMRIHQYSFTLWPQRWATYSEMHEWKLSKLIASERDKIPIGSGIYTLLTIPEIANHPACSYLMYVGQTVSLRRRFGEYLNQEQRESGRPKIFRFLKMYSKQVWFCFTLVDPSLLDATEEGLKNAYIPPLNDRYSGVLGKVVGAF